MGAILTFWCPKLWNYEEVLKQEKQDKNGKNVPQLEITEVMLFNCNIVNNKY